jgi:hypothetical protein
LLPVGFGHVSLGLGLDVSNCDGYVLYPWVTPRSIPQGKLFFGEPASRRKKTASGAVSSVDSVVSWWDTQSMKKKKLHPSDLVLRCMVIQRKGGYWVGMCIDLDLVVQADSFKQAQALLREQMVSYLKEAFTVDKEHASYLLSRRAPLRYFALYYGIKWVNHAKRWLSYEAALPLAIARA